MEKKETDTLALYGVKISSSVKDRLDREKVHPREPYTEVIGRLLDLSDKHKKK